MDIYLSECPDEVFHRLLAPVVAAHIAHVNLGLDSISLALLCNLNCPLRALVAANTDVGALVSRERNRGAGTYAVG